MTQDHLMIRNFSNKQINLLALAALSLGKLENIVAETLFFINISLFVHLEEDCRGKQKMFPNTFRNNFVAETMFPSLPNKYSCHLFRN